jgi:molybdate transport system ATP-binding protein
MPKQPVRQFKPFLSIQDATFRLGDRLVFEQTTWTLHEGEQWAIIGPNGSGKSVLADGLRGRLPLVHGDLCYHFRPPNGLAPEEAIGHVAFEDRKSELHGTVVQSRWTSFEEEASLRVADFLSYERVMEVNPFEVTIGHKSRRLQFERRLSKALRLLRIKPFLPRTLLSLSNGERQRIQLARALALPLKLLILDEPYVGLDVAAREYFHRVVETLLKTRLRILLVTTRTEDLPRHVTHLLRLENCRVAAAGTRAVVLAPLQRGIVRKVTKAAPPLNRLRLLRKIPINPGKTIIELHDVTVRYRAATILRNLNWTVREGESWALLGPNGSGKTTLLSLIQGDHPQAYVNKVAVFGRQRGTGESLWELKKRIGWVSPELQLHFDDNVSVLDAVLSGFFDTIGLFEQPTPTQMTAARLRLAQFGLLAQSEAPLFSLSAGLQRMTLLARALVKNPPLLILDEPCQGLDPQHRDRIIDTVDALIRSNWATAIFVTHRQEEIPSSIKRVLRLSRNC